MAGEYASGAAMPAQNIVKGSERSRLYAFASSVFDGGEDARA
jgi:hypothetical protein